VTDETVPQRPLLRGERVWLRPLEERDMPAYVAGINDTEVGGLAGYAVPLSVAQATAWLGRVMEGWGRDGYFFAICPLGEDRFIGTTWLKELNLLHGNAELAIFMDRDHIGGGWGTDAQRALLSFAFRSLGLERVYLTTAAEDNERAIRSYQKVGFQVEGRMRSAYRGFLGLHDALLMSILRSEWRETPGAGDQ
jgi:RimJ/RimL family protein N-acetyltransferase